MSTMTIMFVCTGNICRSPMGELLLQRYLQGQDVTVTSAGTMGLPSHPIDPSSARLLDSVGIDSSRFRSKRLTSELAQSADLILCFEKEQRQQIVLLDPTAVRRTFLLPEFANLCVFCCQAGYISGNTFRERIDSVIDNASMVRPMIPEPSNIPDPHHKEFSAFYHAGTVTNDAIRKILKSIRGDTDVEPFQSTNSSSPETLQSNQVMQHIEGGHTASRAPRTVTSMQQQRPHTPRRRGRHAA